MKPSNSPSSEMDEDAALKRLLDVFSAVCSLEEIASAYMNAGGDLNAASEILFQSQKTTAPADVLSSGSDSGFSDMQSRRFQNGEQLDESSNLGKVSRVSKAEKLSASSSMVSPVPGNGYYSSRSSQSDRPRPSKPSKIELKEPVVDPGTLETSSPASIEENGPTKSQETVDFLFSMLGDGFKLEKGEIKDVLSSCGYDAKKTMEHFLAAESSELDKSKTLSPDAQNELDIENSHISLEVKISITTRRSQLPERDAHLSSTYRKSSKIDSSKNKKSALQREILESLFCAPKIPEEVPKRTRLPMGLNRTRTGGQRPVSVPLDDVDSTSSVNLPKVSKDEDREDEYLVHRKASKQNWEMMRAYYEAAVDAFMKGERGRADYLQEQGNFYLKMAQEADEKSAGLVLTTREREDEFVLNLHEHRPKEAVKLLKFHLQYLAGISSYQYMKVLLGADDGDNTNGKRRKLVLQFLEKESIQWTEDVGTICIQVGAIDRGKLSFIKDL